jgi:hypothetical protein
VPLAPLGGGSRAVVAHAEEVNGSCHIFGPAEVEAYDGRESAPVWLCCALRDQLVVDGSGERQVGHAIVVDVPDLTSPEPVDGDGTPVWILADAGPTKHLALDQRQ